jgi:hypothetical protein
VHAGWRGIVAGVVPHAVAAVGGDLLAAIGPCISAEHFEVGEEVATAFEEAGLGSAISRRPGPKPHIDLRAAVRQQLIAADVHDRDIDTTTACTYGDAADYFSHRRDVAHQHLPTTGRMAAVIAPAP